MNSLAIWICPGTWSGTLRARRSVRDFEQQPFRSWSGKWRGADEGAESLVTSGPLSFRKVEMPERHLEEREFQMAGPAAGRLGGVIL